MPILFVRKLNENYLSEIYMIISSITEVHYIISHISYLLKHAFHSSLQDYHLIYTLDGFRSQPKAAAVLKDLCIAVNIGKPQHYYSQSTRVSNNEKIHKTCILENSHGFGLFRYSSRCGPTPNPQPA